MNDENDKNDDSDWVTEGEIPPRDPARANRKYRGAKELRELTLERMGQVSRYRSFLDYLQVFDKARQAYYLAFARNWRPERDEGHLELFLFVEQVYCEMLAHTSAISEEGNSGVE